MVPTIGGLRSDPRLDALRPLVRRLRRTAHGLGVDFSMRTPDRQVLEQVILPALKDDPAVETILFVGCDWYTHKYERLFEDRTYWTLEIDPGKDMFGSRRHVTDSLVEVGRHFAPETFDVVVCNGVFGWGLDEKSDVEKAFRGVRECLKPGGFLVLGWNDVDEHRPQPLPSYQWFSTFRPYVFPPVNTSQYETGTENRHIYSFFVR